MAKRSVVENDSEWIENLDEPEEVVEVYSPQVLEINLPKPTSLPVMLQIDCLLKVRGSVTGEIYVFNGAGSIVDVDIQDVPSMLAKSLGRPCCSPSATKYFVLAY